MWPPGMHSPPQIQTTQTHCPVHLPLCSSPKTPLECIVKVPFIPLRPYIVWQFIWNKRVKLSSIPIPALALTIPRPMFSGRHGEWYTETEADQVQTSQGWLGPHIDQSLHVGHLGEGHTLGEGGSLRMGQHLKELTIEACWPTALRGAETTSLLRRGTWVTHASAHYTDISSHFSLQTLQADFKLLQISALDSLCPVSRLSLIPELSILSKTHLVISPLYLWFVIFSHVFLSLWVSLVLHLCLLRLLSNFAPLFTIASSSSIKTKYPAPNNEIFAEHIQPFIFWTYFHCVTRMQRVKVNRLSTLGSKQLFAPTKLAFFLIFHDPNSI